MVTLNIVNTAAGDNRAEWWSKTVHVSGRFGIAAGHYPVIASIDVDDRFVANEDREQWAGNLILSWCRLAGCARRGVYAGVIGDETVAAVVSGMVQEPWIVVRGDDDGAYLCEGEMENGVIAIWYPTEEEAQTAAELDALARLASRDMYGNVHMNLMPLDKLHEVDMENIPVEEVLLHFAHEAHLSFSARENGVERDGLPLPRLQQLRDIRGLHLRGNGVHILRSVEYAGRIPRGAQLSADFLTGFLALFQYDIDHFRHAQHILLENRFLVRNRKT